MSDVFDNYIKVKQNLHAINPRLIWQRFDFNNLNPRPLIGFKQPQLSRASLSETACCGPQQYRRNGENYGEKGGNRFAIFVDEFASAVPVKTDLEREHMRDLGDTFWKGLIGFLLLALAYAGLKRL
jgi:hypothetical protein